MNRTLRLVSLVAAAMFFALLVNITVSYVVRTDDLNANPNNRRVRESEFTQPRGPILVSNSPVASTQDTTGRFNRTRVYANGPLYAQLTGFYSYTYGRSGLEQTYNTQLTGTDDSQFISRMIDTLAGRQPEGATVQTTINPKAQEAAWNALAGRRGAVVAMDYTTGAVLAYVSSPSYDPNVLASSDLAAGTAAWDAWQADPTRPMADRATREVYPPGSVFKLVTAAAALNAGYTNDTMIDSPDVLRLPDTSIDLGNVQSCGGAQINLEQALRVSCNTAFANVGLDLGAERLRTQAEAFGFGRQFTGDFASATSRFPANPDRPQLAMSAIGQYEVAATPLQMAVVASAIANDGITMEPYLVSEVRNPDLSVLSQHHANQIGNPMTAANAQTLAGWMQTVVASGSGRNAAVSGLTIGGKTGTAQSDPSRPNYAWFAGYARELHAVVAVFVEDPAASEDAVSGGRTAAPVARAMFQALR